jgi:hypothetical protein
MTKKTKITAEQIEASLEAFCREMVKPTVTPDVIPPGWFTVSDLAHKSGKAPFTVSQRIRNMVKNGEAERKDFAIQLEQVVRKTPHYRLLTK